MKNNYLYNWVVIVFMMLQMLAFTSCSDDDDNSGWPTETDKTEIFIERFSTLVTNLTALRDGATYGELKDNYPVSSKAMLDDEIVYLEETIAKLKEGNKKLADSEADRIIREANQPEHHRNGKKTSERLDVPKTFYRFPLNCWSTERMADTLILVFIRSIQLSASRGNKHSQSSSG